MSVFGSVGSARKVGTSGLVSRVTPGDDILESARVNASAPSVTLLEMTAASGFWLVMVTEPNFTTKSLLDPPAVETICIVVRPDGLWPLPDVRADLELFFLLDMGGVYGVEKP